VALPRLTLNLSQECQNLKTDFASRPKIEPRCHEPVTETVTVRESPASLDVRHDELIFGRRRTYTLDRGYNPPAAATVPAGTPRRPSGREGFRRRGVERGAKELDDR
jgi:hypothetical protein